MASSLANEIKQRLIALVRDNFNLELDDVVSEIPPKTELGDLAFPLAFDLAKRLKAATGEKKNPREIATKLADGLKTVPGVARVEIAGPGYLNVFFNRSEIFSQLANENPQSATDASGRNPQSGKLIVEHTSINPNKAAHIGHVRNSVLGDTTARILKATGENVEIHNYIDNTGVQVADVVVGFMHLENKSLDQIKAIAERPVEKREDSFDYYCWELYSRVGAWYEEDKTRLQVRAQTLHDIEAGGNATAESGEYISSKIVNCHLETMARLDISYDLLARESEILHLHFWAHAFEKLKASGVIILETEGRNKGCWVMRAEESPISNLKSETEEAEHDADKIIVRSNGTVTYTGKDIAYHLWKLGKLGLDFHYKMLRHDHHGREVWLTTADEAAGSAAHPPFGNGTAFLNVIDVGQSYPQANVKKGVMMLATSKDELERVARSAHLAYEKVTLTPAAARELGTELSEADAERQQIGMSGRKGLGVKADDLIDRLEANALKEVASRHTDLTEAQQHKIAHQIAVAALRYFLLKYTRTSIIAFDFEEALKFRGETGPYLQYSVRRLSNIFTELGKAAEEIRGDFAQLSPAEVTAHFSGEAGDVLWSLVYFASRLDDAVQQAATTFEPTHVAKFAFQLADQFNTFYQDKRFHILKESDPKRKTVLLMAVDVVRQKLSRALSVLGIEVPERM